jgi:hypothetical protein
MATTTNKSASKAGTGKTTNKAAFVRSLPSDMSAAQVIAKARANGIKLSPAYVYVIRSKSSTKPSGKVTPKTRGGDSSERQFVDLALQLGLLRAQQLLDGARASVQRVVLG